MDSCPEPFCSAGSLNPNRGSLHLSIPENFGNNILDESLRQEDDRGVR